MASDHDTLWRRCSYLGRVLLPLLDQEPWRRGRCRKRLRCWGIDVAVGERLMEILTVLAAHAVAVDSSLSAARLEALPLGAVADAATGKQDFELLAGLPGTFADDRDGIAVAVFRLYTGGRAGLRLLLALPWDVEMGEGLGSERCEGEVVAALRGRGPDRKTSTSRKAESTSVLIGVPPEESADGGEPAEAAGTAVPQGAGRASFGHRRAGSPGDRDPSVMRVARR